MTVSRNWNDPVQVKQYYKDYREANKEHIAANKREHYLENREEILETQSVKFAEKRHRYWDLRNEVFDLLGRKCSRCSFSDIRALQVDGIKGGDSKLRKQYGSRWMQYILEHPTEFQILCANCNWIKKHERGDVHSRASKTTKKMV